MDDRMEQIIDALECRVTQMEDRVYKDANDTDRKALRHRRQMYYKVINGVSVDA